MLYAAKCHWPGVTETNLELVAERAVRTTASRDRAAYLGSLLFSADDLVLCFFEGSSRTAVKHVSGRLGIPCEQLMDSSWLSPGRLTRERKTGMIRRLAGVITVATLFAALAAAPSQASPWHPDRLLGFGPAFGAAGHGAPFRSAGTGAAHVPGGRPGTIGTLPRVLVGKSPQDAAFDPATRTVYVANQSSSTISVVNARRCNARDTTGCSRAAPAFPAGNGPFSLGIDDATHTLYVTDGNTDTVSVFNIATCNAADTAGCGHITATLKTGEGPADIAVEPATDTLYVTNAGAGISGAGDTVSVINGATCNAGNTSGCGQTPATVTVGHFAFFDAFDPANKTVYVTDALDNAVSMINARTCHAGDTAGCGRKPPMVAVGNFPVPVVVDPHTDTVYAGNNGEPTVSLINGATCNATKTTGCDHSPATLHVLGGPDGLAINKATDTLFVANNGPGTSTGRANTVSVINAATCNATKTSGCDQHAPVVLTGANPGGNTVDEKTNTLYVTTFDDTLQVINGATCTARVRTGCGQPVPATLGGSLAFSTAINPATHTVYVGDSGASEGFPFEISVLDAATCNTAVSSGCRPNPPTIAMKGNPYGLAVDQATDTLYATNIFTAAGRPGSTVSVIDGARCNAMVTSGCRKTPPTVTVGSDPAGLAVDEATNTIYVANSGGTTVSVINGADCNGKVTSGCGRKPRRVHLGKSPLAVAVNQATDTIYALSPGTPGTVSVIDGAMCNGTVTSGCGKTPPTVTVGNGNVVAGLAVNQATDTIYAVNTIDNTVSVINGATCNRKVTFGCGRKPAHIDVGRQGFGFAAADPATDLVYVTNNLDDTVSVINGATCNGKITSGCNQIPPTVPAGGNPAGIALEPGNHTVYVADNGLGPVSFFHFRAPGRPARVTASTHHGRVSLAWRPPRHGGLPIIYQVIPAPACPACRGLNTPSTSGVPFTTIVGLTRGQTYTFKVKATDAAGTGPVSAPSNPVTS
jgi:DNA-binding beta-propeller fold protein YncE